MACDFCGQQLGWGAVRTNDYEFCSQKCAEQGRIFDVLKTVPKAQLDDYVMRTHMSECSTCKKNKGIDAHPSYEVWSALVITRWTSSYKIQCVECAKSRQRNSLVFSLIAGWWGVPWGIFITPLQVIRNIGALRSAPKVGEPSAKFYKLATTHLAKQMVSGQR